MLYYVLFNTILKYFLNDFFFKFKIITLLYFVKTKLKHIIYPNSVTCPFQRTMKIFFIVTDTLLIVALAFKYK